MFALAFGCFFLEIRPQPPYILNPVTIRFPGGMGKSKINLLNRTSK